MTAAKRVPDRRPPDRPSPDRPSPDRRLLVSIHDVSPAFADPVEQLAETIGAILGGPRFAMLVVPDHWGAAPLDRAPAFARRLRGWADAGVEMFLHGWFHRDTSDHRGRGAAIKARYMTAGEGEFLGLSADEAEYRMRRGREVVEQAIGRPVAGFIAPAWLYGDGAKAALKTCDFALAEDHFRVWRPATDAVVARGPVVTWASRSTARTASSLAVAAAARALPDWLPTLRVAVHPGDVTKESLMTSIDRTIRSLSARRTVARYADLLPEGGRAGEGPVMGRTHAMPAGGMS
ncbi:MAG TPA: polysaccharide deacetylase family protein [Sphingomonas sp.]|nr:polysaccharide deacetylase family protein [Sphingomonas sp.]